jgi:DNA-binding XRE family transcriptional regulator
MPTQKPEAHPLRRYREDMGLSQEALAKKLGVNSQTIFRWETGKRLPRRGLWPKIAAETGVRPAEFLRFAQAAA